MDLLQELANKLHCSYLSDLRYVPLCPGADSAILALSETAYSLPEYVDAANYILDQNAEYPSILVAKMAIINGVNSR